MSYISIAGAKCLITQNMQLAMLESWENLKSTASTTITSGQWDPRYNVTQAGRIITASA